MKKREQFLEIMNVYEKDKNLEQYDPGHWNYLLWKNSYVKRTAENLDVLAKDAEKNGFYINEGLSPEVLEAYQKRCKFKIPQLLKDIWTETNGFIFSRNAKETSKICPSSMPMRFGILPIEGAFGGEKKVAGTRKLLSEPLLSPELFEGNLEFGFLKKGKVGIKGLLKNCIFLELFSEDLLCYTLYKMDHDTKEKYHPLYLVLEYGPYPLSISLEEYINAMFDFKGLVFAWPIMFIVEDNVAPEVLDKKHELIEAAKKNNELLNLEIDFSKYGL